jgi:hypothetical protein
MNQEIIMGSQGGGLGDNLQITPIFKYFKNSKMQIINSDYGKEIGQGVYDGLTDIEYHENPIKQEKSFEIYGDPNLNYPLRNGALNYLTIFGIEKFVSPIPIVTLNEIELNIAQENLKKYNNPIAIVTYGNGFGKSDTNQKYPIYRLLDSNKWQILIDELSKKYTVLHFCKDESLLKFNNCIEINNISIYQLKHYFAIIKKYIGIDTGSYHLMIAAGGFSHVLAPRLSWEHQYYPPNWQYAEELWWDEKTPRVKYYDKDIEWEKVLNNV